MRKFKKTMALGLCAATLSSAVPAFAAEPVQRTHETGTWEPFKPSLDGGKPVISKIPKDHAYIPKDTVLSVILTSELTSKRARKGEMGPLKLAENFIVCRPGRRCLRKLRASRDPVCLAAREN